MPQAADGVDVLTVLASARRARDLRFVVGERFRARCRRNPRWGKFDSICLLGATRREGTGHAAGLGQVAIPLCRRCCRAGSIRRNPLQNQCCCYPPSGSSSLQQLLGVRRWAGCPPWLGGRLRPQLLQLDVWWSRGACRCASWCRARGRCWCPRPHVLGRDGQGPCRPWEWEYLQRRLWRQRSWLPHPAWGHGPWPPTRSLEDPDLPSRRPH